MPRAQKGHTGQSRVTKKTAATRGPRQEYSARKGFKYRPLEAPNTIRIVVLKKGSRSDPVQCRLRHLTPVEGFFKRPSGWSQKNLKQAPSIAHIEGLGRAHIQQYERYCRNPIDLSDEFYTAVSTGDHSIYEALSYEWGKIDDESDADISVNQTKVRVRKNLYDALVELRYEQRDRNLWIDALSIDQSNVEEKNHQVGMMGDIYRGAENVIVWLGPACNGSDDILDLLNGLGPDWAEPGVLQSCLDSMNETEGIKLTALYNRSYWSRAWVQQELYLARRFAVHCGTKRMSDVKMVRIHIALFGYSGNRDSLHKSLKSPASTVMTRIAVRGNFMTLRRWLGAALTECYQASEPRDIIYALLDISSDCQYSQIIPDYNKPCIEVYLETVAFCNLSAHFRPILAERLGLPYDQQLQEWLEVYAASKSEE